jgi:type II secretory pathway component PulF
VSCGLQQPNAWRLSAAVSGSPVLEDDAPRILEHYRDGISLGEALEEMRSYYPQGLVQMVHAGEESGRLSMTIAQAGMLYEQEMDHRIEIFSALLEPLLLSVVSMGVGTIIFAIFLPLYGLISQINP